MKIIHIEPSSGGYPLDNVVITTIEKISDYNYKVYGDFSSFSDTNYTYIYKNAYSSGFDFVILGLIYEKSDNWIKIYTCGASSAYNANNLENVFGSVNVAVYNHSSHGRACRNKIINETIGIINKDNIFLWNQNPNLEFNNYLGLYDFKVITTSAFIEALSDSDNRESYLTEYNLGRCRVHGANEHSELPGNLNDGSYLNSTTELDLMCIVSAGDNLGNSKSYGSGLEFYLNCENYGVSITQSNASPIIGGMIAKLLVNHSSWNFHDARQALRQTASNWDTGWSIELIEGDTRDKGGFGAVDYTSANALTDSELLSMSPLRQETAVNSNNVQFTWLNSPQNNFSETVIAMFKTEPDRDTTPNVGQIVYQGTAESYTYENYGNIGTVWFVFYTLDINGNYSKIESYDKEEVTINQSFTSDVQRQLVNSGNKSSLVSSSLL